MRTARNSQRGFVLIAALALAILYFMLMELILMDSSLAQAEAQQYKARVTAAALAENGAELAAQDIANRGGANVVVNDPKFDVTGTLRRNGPSFELEGTAKTKEVKPQVARVTVQGRINPQTNTIEIDYTIHSQ